MRSGPTDETVNDMDANQQQNVPSLFLANQLLTRAARAASESLDTYSGWMLAGFGAAFSLALANIQTVSKFVAVASLRRSAFLFLAALMVGVVQKFLASLVASSAAAGLEGEALGQANATAGVDLDFAVVFGEMERAILFPFRWVVKRALGKVPPEDLTVGGRMCFMLSQIQGWLVLAESILALVAAAIIVQALAV